MQPRLKYPRCSISWGAFALAMLTLTSPRLSVAQVSPEESARKLKPAEGLEATLWAAEPMVNNPTTMDIDSRGRVWITEGLNYRLTRGGNKGFQKIEEADRIKILEDTNGDGKADKVTVFADHIFPVPMGIAVEERYGKDGKYAGCKVYVGNSPNILVLEDTNGDDKADQRYSLLTGFGGVDSDHGVHGMALGLDGKLYFTHGDGCCSVQHDHSERQQNFDVVDNGGRHVWTDQLANTLRVNRDGTEFEILADRQRNNYETSLNAFGNIFTSDNDDDGNRGSRVIWILDGGHYGYRTPGSPRHWGEEVPGNVPKLVGTGNGSPCGIAVYEGTLLPEPYRGAVLEADAGSRQINHFPITRHGASFRTDYKVFLASDDPWFRPVDMTTAPDGSVFVADWYDAGVGGHSFRDQNTGRIYRVAPAGSKTKPVAADFTSGQGLIEALKSPVVATQDAARRAIIERAKDSDASLVNSLRQLHEKGEPIHRARALWVLHAIEGDSAAEKALKDEDPRIREQAVRILGRDDRENGHVEYKNASAKHPAAALAHLTTLLPLASDSDAGVRRELISALRNLPTDKVGEALKTLAKNWDGRDRWYLEALGLAIENREPGFVAEFFDGTLYGDLDLAKTGEARDVALPPYFPVDRNEAYIVVGSAELPANALTKTLGLAWRVHRTEVLPFLGKVSAKLATPELQQAADDIINQISDPSAPEALAALATKRNELSRRQQVLLLLARKLDSSWRQARGNVKLLDVISEALADPQTQLPAIEAAAATANPRFVQPLTERINDPKAPEDVRAAAVEALGHFPAQSSREKLVSLVEETKGQSHSNRLAEAAVRALPRTGDVQNQLLGLITSGDHPLGLRREALRTLTRLSGGGQRIVDLAKASKLPADLKTEATTILNSSADRRVRDQAAQVLPLPKTKSGRPLPPIGELIRRDGSIDRGREIFFASSAKQAEAQSQIQCGSCHRVQGQGEWIGPDLSTIGTKYGKDELLRSILNPSAAIGYNYRSQIVMTKNGQVYTGLPVEDGPEKLVLKTADGERVTIRPSEIEDRATSDVSLMPEGLAETMNDQDLVDLLTFLAALRQPVSVVGQYQVIGPVSETNGTAALDPTKKLDLKSSLQGSDGQKLSWRRVDANAEGRVDFANVVGTDPQRAAYLCIPVGSSVAQDARVVLDSKTDVKVWLNGSELALTAAGEKKPRSAVVRLPQGRSELLIRVAGSPSSSLVTTVVADRPLDFSAEDSKSVSH